VEVVDWFQTYGGVSDGCRCCHINHQNPYLRPPVVLDEYVKNREVWDCPSSQMVGSFMVNPAPGGDWFQALMDNPGTWGDMTCNEAFPPGWGGDLTDSFLQDALSTAGSNTHSSVTAKTFRQSIGTPRANWDLRLATVDEVTKRVVVADMGYEMDTYRVARVAYPDRYGVEKAACKPHHFDWENCPWTVECGAGDPRFATDTQYRKENGRTRHLGGSNIGFADGHAAWMSSETLLWNAPMSPAPWGWEAYTPPAEIMPSQILIDGLYICCFEPQ
jgi:prepilin-type processing-associated H-X9-DG protein